MNTLRLIAALLLFAAAVVLPWWVVLPLACGYVCYFSRAYEVVLIAACIDGFFGAGLTLPYYTIAALALIMAAHILKPSLSIFTNHRV